jgi:hypothetical protein
LGFELGESLPQQGHQRCAISRDSLGEMLGAGLAFPKGTERIAEIVLGFRPVERDAVAGRVPPIVGGPRQIRKEAFGGAGLCAGIKVLGAANPG